MQKIITEEQRSWIVLLCSEQFLTAAKKEEEQQDSDPDPWCMIIRLYCGVSSNNNLTL